MEAKKGARIDFLIALMYDAAQYSFDSILKCYAAWEREVELCKLINTGEMTSVRQGRPC